MSKHLSFDRLFITALSILAINFSIHAQEKPLPIIDVHVHAMNLDGRPSSTMCPWFLSDMPGADPHGTPPNFLNKACADPLESAISSADYEKQLL
ncbi:MAG: hypothetical protein VW441_09240, partial [Flavobacteriaceae bacterium]